MIINYYQLGKQRALEKIGVLIPTLAGAAIGALTAPSEHRLTGALAGGTLGLASHGLVRGLGMRPNNYKAQALLGGLTGATALPLLSGIKTSGTRVGVIHEDENDNQTYQRQAESPIQLMQPGPGVYSVWDQFDSKIQNPAIASDHVRFVGE